MGIDDRDYLREERYTAAFPRSGRDWAIKYLLIANIAVFLLQNAFPGVTRWLDLRLPEAIRSDGVPFFTVDDLGRFRLREEDAARVLDAGTRVFIQGYFRGYAIVDVGGEKGFVPADEVGIAPARFWELLWRLVTYGFCHSTELAHIAFNMYILWMFGRNIEPVLGSREFLAFYIGAIVASGVCHLVVQAFDPVPVLGASGGVMGVVFLTAMYFPRATVLLFFVFPIELRWLAVLYAVVDIAGATHVFGSTHVAHAAHLGGAAFGVAYKYFGWRFTPAIERFAGWLRSNRRRFARPQVRLHQPSDDEIRARVDLLLDKIHREGEASLTDEERAFLRDASRKFGQR